MQDKVALTVERGGIAVDEDEIVSAEKAHKPRRRVDGEGRPRDNERICRGNGADRSLSNRHILENFLIYMK